MTNRRLMLATVVFLCAPLPIRGAVLINEIQLYEDPGSPDARRNTEWVEFVNTGPGSVDLTGFVLADRDGPGGAAARPLPAVVMPPGAYLRVVLGAGTSDLDFADGCAEQFTGDLAGANLFSELQDEAALFTSTGIVDFVAWARGSTGYVPGGSHNVAVAAAIWTSGEFVDIARHVLGPFTKFRRVLPGFSLGRDRDSTDTDRPFDWDVEGGRHASDVTPCERNLGVANLVFSPEPPAPPKAWTIMVYIAGDNDLEKFAFDDLKEMEAAGGSDATVNVVVMLDGFAQLRWVTENALGELIPQPGSEGKTWRFQVGPEIDLRYVNARFPAGQSPHLGERNMGAPGELSGFVTWAKANYPATKYGLILWDHGQGWKGICEDDHPDNGSAWDALFMGEIETALTGQTFELIGFDACLMAMIEVAHQVQPFGRYAVFSEELESGDGWPYHLWLAGLKANPAWTGAQLGTRIVADYDAYYAGVDAAGLVRDESRTLSAVNLTTLPGLVAAVSGWSAELRAGVDDFKVHKNPDDNVARAIDRNATLAERFEDRTFMDLRDFGSRICDDATIPFACNACYKASLPTVLDQSLPGGPVVIAERHGPGNPGANGLSISLPLLRTTATPAGKASYDYPEWSRTSDSASQRAAYALNDDCLPFLARDVETGVAIPAPPQWTLVPSPDFEFPIDTAWDEFLQRFYHPVSDNHIDFAICPDGKKIFPVIVDPICGNPIDEITVPLGSTVFFRGDGSSDVDTPTELPIHWMWDLDQLVDDCPGCPLPYVVAPGADAATAGNDMDPEQTCSGAPLTDEKGADAVTASKTVTEIRDYLIHLYPWDDNHLFGFHNTLPSASYVHPQTDIHPSIVHVTNTFCPASPGLLLFTSKTALSWGAAPAGTTYDVVKGSLPVLRSSGGDFTLAISACVENDSPDAASADATSPSVGGGFFYLTRSTAPGGVAGTYSTGHPKEAPGRDFEIITAPGTCP